MSRKPNKKREKIAKELIQTFSTDTTSIINLRKAMASIAKRNRVKTSYVSHVWYNYVCPLKDTTKRCYCFFTNAVGDYKIVWNRKVDTHNVGYLSH